jgi:hypothetical protein
MLSILTLNIVFSFGFASCNYCELDEAVVRNDAITSAGASSTGAIGAAVTAGAEGIAISCIFNRV